MWERDARAIRLLDSRCLKPVACAPTPASPRGPADCWCDRCVDRFCVSMRDVGPFGASLLAGIA